MRAALVESEKANEDKLTIQKGRVGLRLSLVACRSSKTSMFRTRNRLTLTANLSTPFELFLRSAQK